MDVNKPPTMFIWGLTYSHIKITTITTSIFIISITWNWLLSFLLKHTQISLPLVNSVAMLVRSHIFVGSLKSPLMGSSHRYGSNVFTPQFV
jgi:hypothetical protein